MFTSTLQVSMPTDWWEKCVSKCIEKFHCESLSYAELHYYCHTRLYNSKNDKYSLGGTFWFTALYINAVLAGHLRCQENGSTSLLAVQLCYRPYGCTGKQGVHTMCTFLAEECLSKLNQQTWALINHSWRRFMTNNSTDTQNDALTMNAS